MRSGRTPDGTRVLWHPADGPTSARLTFRVGVADETLPTRGMTHLVEHLAHERIGLPLYECNAYVGAWCTSFDVSGDAPEVAAHLRELSAALCDLPLEQMDREVGVLRLEEARHGGVREDHLLVHRFGLRGPALSAVRETGLDHLRPQQVRDWARSAFTTGGAVLSVWGAEPSADWLALPAGPGRHLQRVQVLSGRASRWVEGPDPAVGLAVLAARRPATVTAWAWLHRRLRHRLRFEDRLVYDVDAQLTRFPGDRLDLGLWAASDVDRREDVVHAFREVVAQACAVGPGPGELLVGAPWSTRPDVTSADTVMGWLDAMARDWLCDGVAPAVSSGEGGATFTAEQVRSEIRQLVAESTWQLPQGCPPPRDLAPVDLAPTVDLRMPGRVFAGARHRDAGQRLVVGPVGVALHFGGSVALGTTWEDCQGFTRYPDGSREVTCLDGGTFLVRPWDWFEGAAAVAELDLVAPAHVVPDASSSPANAAVPPARLLSGLSRLSAVSLVVLLLATSLTGLLLAGSAPGSVHPVAVGLIAGVAFIGCGALLVALVQRLRVPRKRRRDPDVVGRTVVSVAVDRAMARADRPLALAIAVGAWAMTVVSLVIAAWRGVAFWPVAFLVVFAVRATREVARRPR